MAETYKRVVNLTMFVAALPTLGIVMKLAFYHKKKGFDTPFRKIFFISTLNDMLTYYLQCFIFTMPSSGLFTYYKSISTGWVPVTISTIYMYVECLQIMITFIISFNRATAVLIPNRYLKWWNRHFWKIMFLMFLVPFIFCCRVTTKAWSWQQYGEAVFVITFPEVDPSFWITLLVYILIFMSCTLIFNMICGYKMMKHHQNKSVNNSSEKLFYFMSLLTFFLQLGLMTAQIFIQASPDGSIFKMIGRASVSTVTDITCLLPIWMLLLLSKDTRNMVWKPSEISTTILINVSQASLKSVRNT